MSKSGETNWAAWGRIGGLTTHARGSTTTEAARAAQWRRYEEVVDPDGVLDPDERAARATSLRRAEMTRIAMRPRKRRPVV